MTAIAEPEHELTTPPPGDDVLDLATAMPMRRRIRLPAEAIATLGLGELVAIGRVTGHRWDALEVGLSGPDGPLIAVGIAWALARRLEPGVTWEDAQSWQVEITGGAPRPPSRTRARRRS